MDDYKFPITSEPQGYDTISHALELNAFKNDIIATNSRLPRSIHFSSYWECPRRQILKSLGTEFTDYMFNWSNFQSKHVGDMFHNYVQTEMRDAGLLSKVPDFSEDEKIRQANRDAGKLVPAIEIDVTSWSTPYTFEQRLAYLEKGIIVPDSSIYDDMQYYGMGGRLDMLGAFPYDAPGTPIEIKTTSQKYFPKTEKELEALSKTERDKYLTSAMIFTGKFHHYVMQLQMQLHFIRNDKGERPTSGVIYLLSQNDINKRISYHIGYDEYFVNSWLPLIREIKVMKDNKIIPEGIPNKNDCSFCEYHKDCNAVGKFDRWINYQGLKHFNQLKREAHSLYFETLAKMTFVGKYIQL